MIADVSSQNELSRRAAVVGETPSHIVTTLQMAGWELHPIAHVEGIAGHSAAPPAAVLLSDLTQAGVEKVRQLRSRPELEQAALVCLTVSGAEAAGLLDAGADEVISWDTSSEQIARRLEQAVRLRQLNWRAQMQQSELEALLDIAQAATSVLGLDEQLQLVVQRIATVVPVDRCSVVLVEGDSATVMASHDLPSMNRLSIQLKRYPELVEALALRTAIFVDDIHTDPRLASVRDYINSLPLRSVFVAPLVTGGTACGAILLRCARQRAFSAYDRAFLEAAAATIANSVRNAQLHQAVCDERDMLQKAHEERLHELKEANETLRRVNTEREKLLEMYSHDVRTPVQVILTSLEILRRTGPVAPAQERALQTIERQGRRIVELVSSIIEPAMSGAQRLQPVELDLVALAHTVIADFAPVAADKQIDVSMTAHPQQALVRGAPSELRQVFENLLANALTYSPSGSRVQVVLQAQADDVRVEVRDSGPGIAANAHKQVFAPYHKGSGSQGKGLGLSICREVIDAHGGKIWVESPAGGGAHFVFTLPVLKKCLKT